MKKHGTIVSVMQRVDNETSYVALLSRSMYLMHVFQAVALEFVTDLVLYQQMKRKDSPNHGSCLKFFVGLLRTKKSSKSPPPLVLGDYRSPRFRLETRLICWDFNQMGPWEKINTRVACAHWVLNSIEAGSNTCHLAALNPRANSRIHWKSRLLSQVNDSWTQLARSWLRVSAKRDALLDILCLAQQQLPSTSVLIISRNKRLIRAIKFHLPKDTKIIVADFRSRDFCLRHKIPIPLLNFGHEFCLYRPADELISSIMEDPEDHKDEEKLRSTIRQKSRVSFIGGRRFFVRRREQQQQQKQKIKGDR
mmetsp:Transcript_1117/g.1395  ORF Transcript_1117/g.1395 Transcript_1117/m.1395 type:complete len:307 (-) Transcript_1117:165-1085(-)